MRTFTLLGLIYIGDCINRDRYNFKDGTQRMFIYFVIAAMIMDLTEFLMELR